MYFFQKSEARPPNDQSPCRTGSVLGPFTSPVTGLVSPSNSEEGERRASGCSSAPESIVLFC